MKCSYPKCPQSEWKSPWDSDHPPVQFLFPQTEPHYCTRFHSPRHPIDFYFETEPVTYQEASRHHALLVLTAPRPQNTLIKTIESLELAGSSRWTGPKIIFSDGPSDFLMQEDWHLHQNASQEGSARASIRSMALALSIHPELEKLTIIEDDVALARNALDYVQKVEIPPYIEFISWFTYDYDFSYPKHPDRLPHPASLGYPVLARRSTRFFILSQACTFTRDAIQTLLTCPLTSRHWPKKHARDELVSAALGDVPYAVHFPILAQHTGGANSAVVHAGKNLERDPGNAQEGDRSSPYYVGDDFDALSLLKR